jgi:hypothetical protein
VMEWEAASFLFFFRCFEFFKKSFNRNKVKVKVNENENVNVVSSLVSAVTMPFRPLASWS